MISNTTSTLSEGGPIRRNHAAMKGTQNYALDDDAQLERLGKRPLLSRNFGFMSILGFSCTTLISWEGALVSSVPTLLNGGPAGVIYGFLVNWVGTISVYLALAEMASLAPTAGGQYHWVAMLAPRKWSNFLSYLTAWLTTTAWQAIAVYSGYATATTLQGIVVLAHPEYVPQSWHTVLILWAAMLFASFMNSTSSRILARFEGVVLVLHLLGFFAILIPMVYLAPHNPPSAVFSTFYNMGGWSSQALSFFVGFPNLASTILGADCAVHMSEEIQAAAIVVPRSLICSVLINGLLALAVLIGLLFCLVDLESALAASETMFYPFLQVFKTSVNSTAGACIMGSIVMVLGIISAVGAYASASRLIWAFSRDRGLPMSSHLVKLSKSFLPRNAVLATLGISVLLSLIAIGSVIALNALLSLVVAGIHSSYLIACTLLLWRRTTGFFQPYFPGVQYDSREPSWGPWRLPEPIGTINNAFACVYSTLLLFWSFWPQSTPTTAETANWSILVFGFVVVSSVLWYALRARHYFRGPIKEIGDEQ